MIEKIKNERCCELDLTNRFESSINPANMITIVRK